MAYTKYDYSCLNQNLTSKFKEFLEPLWNWKKIEISENTVPSASNNPYVKFYVDDKTCIFFQSVGYEWATMYVKIMSTKNASETFSYTLCDVVNFNVSNNQKSRIRFTKVGESGFFIGFDCQHDSYGTLIGDYTLPLIMCCGIGNTYALTSCELTVGNIASGIPTATTNNIFYDGMTAIETVSLTRRATESTEQLIPICTNTGLYSTNGFTPAITYNNALSPQAFKLNGHKYYGNGLMVLLDEE